MYLKSLKYANLVLKDSKHFQFNYQRLPNVIQESQELTKTVGGARKLFYTKIHNFLSKIKKKFHHTIGNKRLLITQYFWYLIYTQLTIKLLDIY